MCYRLCQSFDILHNINHQPNGASATIHRTKTNCWHHHSTTHSPLTDAHPMQFSISIRATTKRKKIVGKRKAGKAEWTVNCFNVRQKSTAINWRSSSWHGKQRQQQQLAAGSKRFMRQAINLKNQQKCQQHRRTCRTNCTNPPEEMKEKQK